MQSPVELRQLRYFVAVAEELHFGHAAQRLHMAQSPLSRAIRELEHELGIVLFVRTTRRVELTPAGVVLLEGARRALAEVEAAIDDARRTAELVAAFCTWAMGRSTTGQRRRLSNVSRRSTPTCGFISRRT